MLLIILIILATVLLWPFLKVILALLYMALTLPLILAVNVFKTHPRTANEVLKNE